MDNSLLLNVNEQSFFPCPMEKQVLQPNFHYLRSTGRMASIQMIQNFLEKVGKEDLEKFEKERKGTSKSENKISDGGQIEVIDKQTGEEYPKTESLNQNQHTNNNENHLSLENSEVNPYLFPYQHVMNFNFSIPLHSNVNVSKKPEKKENPMTRELEIAQSTEIKPKPKCQMKEKPKKKRIILPRITKSDLHRISVNFKPGRSKGTPFTTKFPEFATSKPHWYQVVVVSPKNRADIEVEIKLKISEKAQSVEDGKYVDYEDFFEIFKEKVIGKAGWDGENQIFGLNHKKGGIKRLRKVFKEGKLNKSYIQFTKTFSKLENRYLKIIVLDKKAGICIFESTPIKVFARKQKSEREYWNNLKDKTLKEENQLFSEKQIKKVTQRTPKKLKQNSQMYPNNVILGIPVSPKPKIVYNRSKYLKKRKRFCKEDSDSDYVEEGETVLKEYEQNTIETPKKKRKII